jgi:phosphopantothenoylcysteine decarboxylase/phosphopantothenate--cysteine ligase
MYDNPIVQNNIERLKSFGYKFLEPEIGTMAMKGEKAGVGRLPKPESIVASILEMKF